MNTLHTFAYGALTGFCWAILIGLPLHLIRHHRALAQGRREEKTRHRAKLNLLAKAAAAQGTVHAELVGGPVDGTVVEMQEHSDQILYRDISSKVHFYTLDPECPPAAPRRRFLYIPTQPTA